MLFFNALKSISSVYVYSISPVAKSSNLLMSIKYFLLSSFKVFGGIPNTTIQHILTFHLIYFNTLTLEKGELANCQDVLVSRPTLAKSARPRDQWSLIAKELIDREGPFKETCMLAVVFANCTCRYKFFSLGFQNNAFFIAIIEKDGIFVANICKYAHINNLVMIRTRF